VIFRKRQSGDDAGPELVAEEAIEANSDGDAAVLEASATEASSARAGGPWDRSEVEDVEDRIDLGALLVAGVPGLSMQVQVDENTQRVTMVTLILEDAAVQIQAFAAPRSAGIWEDVRRQISGSISGSGGLVETAEGPFGPELRARVPGPDKKLQPARFVGVDGPRWFLRGLFLGSAASPDGHAGLTDVFANIVVDRGSEAMPSGEPLPLHLPPQDPPADSAEADPAT